MSIRLRTVEGLRVALCAAETDAMPGDVYLDDSDHYALAAKFCRDWQGQHEFIDWSYPEEWAAMDTQKVRDAETELNKWLAEQPKGTAMAKIHRGAELGALAGILPAVLRANPSAEIVGSIVNKVLTAQDTPIEMKDVQATTEKVMAVVAEEVADKVIAIVPVKSGFFSKINWTALGGPSASLVASLLAAWGLDFTAEQIVAIVAACQVIQSAATMVFRQFFTKSITPQSAK